MTTSPSNMADADLQTLRQLVYDRTGIWYAESKLYLLGIRGATHMRDLGVETFTDYMRAVTSGLSSEAAFRELCDRITINETSFFRDRRQLEVFEKRVLADLIKSRSATKRLRIWSAACSTGEEPYTLAMIVRRKLGVQLSGWNVEILGTDLSQEALETARGGVYSSYAVRSLDPVHRDTVFSENANGSFELDPTVRQMVRFEHQNLTDARGMSRRGVWDAIFCRNVLIYFDEASRQKCVAQFRRLIAPDGSLLLGHSESMNSRTDFLPLGEPGGFAWTPQPTLNRTERSHVA